MPGFNNHIELDEVHTPSRYLSCFHLFLGRSIVLFHSCCEPSLVFPSLSLLVDNNNQPTRLVTATLSEVSAPDPPGLPCLPLATKGHKDKQPT